ncbi:MAG: hypothetical protein J6J61_08390, partial [Muribaculaceae bacterium]|nr:hypothetical protein [Muribaculaceae bacterium]
MKNLCLFVFIAISLAAGAKTVQKGFVQEYNEKARKTPLPGVELDVRSAQSTVSDSSGRFTLDFLTLKPGERVSVRRIEKVDYEILNKEAIEQWNINPAKPFNIKMCRSDKFKRIRDNNRNISIESYVRQHKKDVAAIEKLKAEGKLRDEEYCKQLSELLTLTMGHPNGLAGKQWCQHPFFGRIEQCTRVNCPVLKPDAYRRDCLGNVQYLINAQSDSEQTQQTFELLVEFIGHEADTDM